MKHLLFLLLLLSMAATASAKTLSKVAAVVNNQIITTYQLDRTVSLALEQHPNRNQMTAAEFDQLRTRVLEKLINDKLLEQRIKELELEVSDPELNAAIEDVQRKNNLTREELVQALGAQGLTMASYREQLKNEILRYKLLGREVNYKVMVTSGEVRDYFREHIDEYKVEPKVRLNHIAFPLPIDSSEENKSSRYDQVVAVRNRLLQGDSFQDVLAAQQDIAAGGDMGELVETELALPLQKALSGLEPGDVSAPLEMGGQLHLFQVSARNPGDIHLFDRVKGEIEETLKRQKTDRRFEEWEKELRANARVEIRL